MNKQAVGLFIAEEKNTRTIQIITALLNNESPTSIAKQYNVTRSAVYKIKDKYFVENS